jgi:hypothetical protein
MKKLTSALIPLFTLAACGNIPDDPAEKVSAASERAGTQRERILSHTESFDEKDIGDAAASLIEEGSSLSSARAESCWRNEAARSAVREACLLAWSAGEEPSTVLEAELINHARDSRPLALALVRRGSLASKLDFNGLLALASALSKDPSWVRGMAIDEWLKAPRTLDLAELRALREAVDLPAEPDPASAFYAYQVARRLGAGSEEELLGAYCDPTALSLAQVRCWRFLSAIVHPGSGLGLEHAARAFLPRRREESWVLFERGFPERARLLRNYR